MNLTCLVGLFLFAGGLICGTTAGLLGIGGAVFFVPLLVGLGYEPIQSVATSSLVMVMIALAGSFENWRAGNVEPARVFAFGLPAVLTTQVGIHLAVWFPPYLLLFAFGAVLLLNCLIGPSRATPAVAVSRLPGPGARLGQLAAGGGAGLVTGLCGVGGGVILVTLQTLLLGETIKTAIRTSLGVVLLTSLSACVGHHLHGSILYGEGLYLGAGGLIGARMGARFLPKLPEATVHFLFRIAMALLACYSLVESWLRFAAS